MCGIAGFIHLGVDQNEASFHLEAMLQSIKHRGPDDEGGWVDDQYGVALGHRRLYIRGRCMQQAALAIHAPRGMSCHVLVDGNGLGVRVSLNYERRQRREISRHEQVE